MGKKERRREGKKRADDAILRSIRAIQVFLITSVRTLQKKLFKQKPLFLLSFPLLSSHTHPQFNNLPSPSSNFYIMRSICSKGPRATKATRKTHITHIDPISWMGVTDLVLRLGLIAAYFRNVMFSHDERTPVHCPFECGFHTYRKSNMRRHLMVNNPEHSCKGDQGKLDDSLELLTEQPQVNLDEVYNFLQIQDFEDFEVDQPPVVMVTPSNGPTSTVPEMGLLVSPSHGPTFHYPVIMEDLSSPESSFSFDSDSDVYSDNEEIDWLGLFSLS